MRKNKKVEVRLVVNSSYSGTQLNITLGDEKKFGNIDALKKEFEDFFETLTGEINLVNDDKEGRILYSRSFNATIVIENVDYSQEKADDY